MMRIVAILFALLISNEVLAEMYKYIDADGIPLYTNKPKNSINKPLRKAKSASSKTTQYFESNGTPLFSDKLKNSSNKLIKNALINSARATGYFYKYIDKQGIILYTNKPKSNLKLISKTEVDLPAFTSASLHTYNRAYTYSGANKSKFNDLIADAASRHQVDARLVHAVIQTESAYNSTAISPAGAVGLMQLMPATARRFGVMDRNDPDQNVDGGTRYLRYLIDLFGPYNLDLAVAAYNAGENAVMKYNNSIPPYPETRNYVKQVLALYNQ